MIKFNNYNIKKMLLNEGGNKTQYNNSNYTEVESKSYLGQDSLMLNMSTLKDPIPENGYSYLGYSIDNTNTLLTDNPTNSTTKSYTLWYDRIPSTPVISNPIAELKSVSNNAASKAQNVTLKCSSSENITKYYFGTNNSPLDSNYTDVTQVSKNAEINIKVEESGNYYFGCMSESGLKSTLINQEYTAYTIKKELLNIVGNKEALDSTNYKEVSSDSYIIPKGSTLLISDVNKNVPSGSNSKTYKGYTLNNNTLKTDNPIINGNQTINMWFDRIEYKISLVATNLVPKISAENERHEIVTATLEDNNKDIVARFGESIAVTGLSSDGKNINWGSISNSTENTINLTPNSNMTIKIEQSSDRIDNPKTGSITHYIKYVLFISLISLFIISMFSKKLILK